MNKSKTVQLLFAICLLSFSFTSCLSTKSSGSKTPHEMIKNNEIDAAKDAEELGKVKEFMVKSAIEAKEKNNSWLNNIVGFELNGVDTFNQAIETINAITVADVQKFMKEFNAQNNYRVVVLDPAK